MSGPLITALPVEIHLRVLKSPGDGRTGGRYAIPPVSPVREWLLCYRTLARQTRWRWSVTEQGPAGHTHTHTPHWKLESHLFRLLNLNQSSQGFPLLLNMDSYQSMENHFTKDWMLVTSLVLLLHLFIWQVHFSYRYVINLLLIRCTSVICMLLICGSSGTQTPVNVINIWWLLLQKQFSWIPFKSTTSTLRKKTIQDTCVTLVWSLRADFDRCLGLENGMALSFDHTLALSWKPIVMDCIVMERYASLCHPKRSCVWCMCASIFKDPRLSFIYATW